MKQLTKNYTPVRIIMMLFSMLPMGVAVAMFELSAFGNNPYSSMGMALAKTTGISFGTMTLITNLVLFVLQLAFGRSLINIGTLVNMVVLGYIVEFVMNILPTSYTMAGRIVLLIVSIVLLCFGASLYFTADLGVAPYDATAFIIEKYTKWPYWVCRIITDVSCVAVCLLFGGVLGVGTLICAFGMGPIISFFNKNVSEKILAAGEKTK